MKRTVLLGQDEKVLGTVSLGASNSWQVAVHEGTLEKAILLLDLLFAQWHKRHHGATRAQFLREGPRTSFHLSAWISYAVPEIQPQDLPTQHMTLYAEVEQEIALLAQEYEARQKTKASLRRA